MSEQSFIAGNGGRRHHRRGRRNAAPSEAKCKAEAGVFEPIINYHRCEGKGDCVEVCPLDVFVIKRMPDEQYSALPVLVKLKLWAHGRKVAFTPNAEACRACGLCVTACPENAVTLKRRSSPPAGHQE